MLQNCIQCNTIECQKKYNILLNETNIQDYKAVVENNICISPDNSNISEEKTQRAPDKTTQISDLKQTISEEICAPVIEIKDQSKEELKSQNAQTYNRKSEITINQKKDFVQQKKTNNFEKCWNKLCEAKGVKKIKSRVNGRPILLCNDCSKNYNLKQYCEYCQQIYAEEAVDGLEWIQCDVQGCGRWNHSSCQKANFEFDNQTRYFCKKCRAHPSNKSEFGLKSQSGMSQKTKQRQQIQDERMKIFKKNGQRFGYLQSMLSSFSYKLSLPEESLRQQMMTLNGEQFYSQDNNPYYGQRGNKKRRYR